MKAQLNYKFGRYSDDFETTTDPEDCRVWAFASCPLSDLDKIEIGNNIEDYIEYCYRTGGTHYFHNLKFDADFLINWMLNNGYRHVTDRKQLTEKTFTTLISEQNQFYTMKICFDKSKRHTCEFLDSLKVIPMKVEQMPKAFNIPDKKLEIDYTEKREKGHKLTPEEIAYIKNDVVIVAKALCYILGQGLTKMTQGSNALNDYKQIIGEKQFKYLYPPPTYDADIRQSYKGGFTYLNPLYKNKDVGNGIVLDVNSLYPSVMYYEALPYGEGKYFKGQYNQDNLYNLYIQKLVCQFELKENHIPTIQIKSSRWFNETEYLTTSGEHEVTLCLTNIDLKLFFEHYDVYNITYIDGYKFKSAHNLFKDYIDKWYSLKKQASEEGNEPLRTLCKLMLNSLYGKFATSPRVCGKIPNLTEEGATKYSAGEIEEKEPIYIPMGSFITSYARNKTIRSAQKVYGRFVYSDTDSLHLLGDELPTELEIDPYKLGAWKHESTFSRAKFIRQKCYMEEIKGELKITCAGLPEECKKYVSWENFKPGVYYPGKLMPVHVPGGTVLVEKGYTMKG